MGDRGNRTGGLYALTVITAISPGCTAEVRRSIEALPLGKDSPLARLGQLHASRLHILDRLVHQGAPQQPEVLANDYLVFTATLDGALDAFLDAIAERLPAEADRWWRHCVGYPGLDDRAAFRRWIRHNQIPTSLFVAASPDRGVAEVVECLAVRERLVEFAIASQGLEAAELQRRFEHTFGGRRR